MRRAFTLVELLVVIAIIGLLVALLLPALSAVLERTRLLQCQNNLRQIGTAIKAYHSSVGSFPITITDRNQLGGGACGTGFYSWRSYILPYLEQSAVYEMINFDLPMSDVCSGTPEVSESHSNVTAARQNIDVFLCPSDGYRSETAFLGGMPANDNYAANFGWPPQSTGLGMSRGNSKTNPYNGVLGISTGNPLNDVPWHPQGALRDRDVTDGLQHTAMVAERLIFSTDGIKDRRRLVFCGGSPAARSQERLVKYCNLVDVPDKRYSSMQGQAWISGYAPFGPGYMHLMPPNDRNCHDAGGELEGNWWASASSNHSGGVNVLMADGRVAWIDESINRDIWWSLGSRDGEEVKRLEEN